MKTHEAALIVEAIEAFIEAKFRTMHVGSDVSDSVNLNHRREDLASEIERLVRS